MATMVYVLNLIPFTMLSIVIGARILIDFQGKRLFEEDITWVTSITFEVSFWALIDAYTTTNTQWLKVGIPLPYLQDLYIAAKTRNRDLQN